MRLSDVEAAARAERARLGYDAEVSAHMEGEQIVFTTGQERHFSHAARDAAAAGFAAVAGSALSRRDLESVRRSLYLAQRGIGDYQAVSTGGLPKLGKRLVRRAVTRRAGAAVTRILR